MVDPQLVRLRLLAQGLARPAAADAHDAVARLGAMQGQDLPGVIASIALRLGTAGPGESALESRPSPIAPEPSRTSAAAEPGSPVARVIAGFDAGTVVRGYPMRGTVFAVAAEDLLWMTELCAGGPLTAQTRRRGQLGLDQAQIDLAREVLEGSAAAEASGIARTDLFALWDDAGMSTAGGRGYHVLSHLVAHRVAAYGPWNGTDNNVVLTKTWLPTARTIAERFDGDRTAATAELLHRYLLGHGPATVRDFAWWTKLPLTSIRAALPLIEDQVETTPELADAAGEARYWQPGLLDEAQEMGPALDALFLLPGFDEIVLGYPDRLDLLTDEHHGRLVPGNNGMFQKPIVRRGRVIGTWKRGGRPGRRALDLTGFTALPKVAQREAERAFARYPHATD